MRLCTCSHTTIKFSTVQYSGLATQVCRGRGKVPVADYKVAKYVSGENGDEPLQATSRSCYSFCMCPGGQVLLSVFEFLDDPNFCFWLLTHQMIQSFICL